MLVAPLTVLSRMCNIYLHCFHYFFRPSQCQLAIPVSAPFLLLLVFCMLLHAWFE